MGALDIKTLCDSMLNPNKSPLENLVATTALYGPQCAAVSYAAQLAQLRNASDFGVGVGIRQWTWQTCNEFGYFQSTDAPPAKQPFGAGVPLDYYCGFQNSLTADGNYCFPTQTTVQNDIKQWH